MPILSNKRQLTEWMDPSQTFDSAKSRALSLLAGCSSETRIHCLHGLPVQVHGAFAHPYNQLPEEGIRYHEGLQAAWVYY